MQRRLHLQICQYHGHQSGLWREFGILYRSPGHRELRQRNLNWEGYEYECGKRDNVSFTFHLFL